jgi:hypothetical protein
MSTTMNCKAENWEISTFSSVFVPVNVSDEVVVMNSHNYQQQGAAKGLQANSNAARRRRTEFRVLAPTGSNQGDHVSQLTWLLPQQGPFDQSVGLLLECFTIAWCIRSSRECCCAVAAAAGLSG